jgi:hypothetical protein
MISHGTRPALHISREKRFKHFGGTGTFPDFSVDAGIWNPSQNADGAPMECVGYTNADLLTDIFKKQFSPDFSYAMARWIIRSGPGTDGTSFHAGMQATVWVGGLLKMFARFSALDKGGLFVSDAYNWHQDAWTAAADYSQNGLRNVLGFADNFTDILSAIFSTKIGVSLGSPWFKEWQGLPNGSVLPMPANPAFQSQQDYTPWHNYAAKGQKTIDNQPMIIIKPWTGGFMYMPRDVANAVFDVIGTGALTFDPKAVHWMSDVAIFLQRGRDFRTALAGLQ